MTWTDIGILASAILITFCVDGMRAFMDYENENVGFGYIFGIILHICVIVLVVIYYKFGA
jgi:uncharacterized membrane-anchored protein